MIDTVKFRPKTVYVTYVGSTPHKVWQALTSPECLVTYDIAPAGDSVKLTMTEAHQWEVPEGLLAGGRAGWPAILSSLKSVLETGKPLSLKMEPPKEMMAALQALKRT